MKFRNFILFIIILVGLSGCYIGEPSYEVFNETLTANMGNPNILHAQNNKRVYSEDRYIYEFERPKGCRYGYLTNKDDKPERVLGWTILSGREFCKERRAWALSF